MNTEYKNKTIFITGGGSGIGRATAITFGKAGANVVVTDIIKENAEKTVNLIKEIGGSAISIKCNVIKSQDIIYALQKTIEIFGKLDFAFNNAGIEYETKSLAEIEEEEWEKIINVNLRGVFLCMKHQIPLMLKNGGGAIVNTSSGAGIRGFKGGAGYVASKHGIIGITKSAALDYATSNIKINAVAPGIIDTEMMDRFINNFAEGREAVISQEPIGRMGSPEEIAKAVLWLCSKEASFIIGHTMIIDGGQTI